MLNLALTPDQLQTLAVLLVILCVVPILILALYAIVRAIKNKTKIAKEHKDNIEHQERDEDQRKEFYEAYGGIENVIELSQSYSRLTVKVIDIEKVNGDKLKELGANNVLLVGDEVKCSFGDRIKYIYNLMK